jgi:hypothetical protein
LLKLLRIFIITSAAEEAKEEGQIEEKKEEPKEEEKPKSEKKVTFATGDAGAIDAENITQETLFGDAAD